jgi:hypothetical protein
MPGKRPRCGKPMKQYALNRLRDYDPAPACGRPAGHPGNCVTGEAWQRGLDRHREYRYALRNRTP